jgi:periplasmic copper chaperone A
LTLRSLLARAAAVGGVAVAVTLAVAAPAFAHVTVNPDSASQGGYTKVSFRVPNEKDNADTTKVEVNLPTDTPIASVSLKPMAGWTETTEKTKLATPITTDDGQITEAITKITWTAAAGNAIKPGQFQEFDVSLGPLPKADQVAFKALQTYSDGDIVRWIEVPTPGGEEPEHPAPVLKLTAAADTAGPSTSAPVSAPGRPDNGGGVDWLGIAGIVLGLAGLVAALLAARRAGRPEATDRESTRPDVPAGTA